MHSKIKIGNFKSIRDLELDLAPITILVGPNGSGKTSVLEAISLLKQGSGRKPPHAYEAKPVNLGSFEEVVYKKDKNNWIYIEINTELSSKESNLLKNTDLPEEIKLPDEFKEIGYGVDNRGDEIKHRALVNGKTVIEAVFLYDEKGKFASKILYPEGTSIIGSLKCIAKKRDLTFAFKNKVKEYEDFSKQFTNIIMDRLEKTYYISGMRGKIPRKVNISERMKDKWWVGVNGEYTVEMLSLIFGNRALKDKREKIIRWAEMFELKDIDSGWTGEKDEHSSTFLDKELGFVLNPASSGMGSRQILPLIIQLFYSEPGSTIMFEEPEISLHIESQLKLPKLFSEVVNEGKQVIMTTHSEHIILALKPLIANGDLKKENVAIWHFEKTKEGTKAERLNLTDKGTVKGWIPSYVKAEKKIIEEWINTLPEA